MIEQTVKIVNHEGLHTRPAAMLVKITSKYKSDVFLARNGFSVNAKSIIGVMTLAAEHNSELTVRLDGEDEDEALQEVLAFFEGGFVG
jgi:phosphocarrier protein HPr